MSNMYRHAVQLGCDIVDLAAGCLEVESGNGGKTCCAQVHQKEQSCFILWLAVVLKGLQPTVILQSLMYTCVIIYVHL